MKSLLAFVFAFALSLTARAQKDVTTFLGIPVDGTKTEMRQKLIAKGFTPKKVGEVDFLRGEFNGAEVDVHIVTNNNKVYRIMLDDVIYRDEANIKTRFNTLVRQFENNARYVTPSDFSLSDDEDISYGMTLRSKTYEAVFYQRPDMANIDTLAFRQQIMDELLKQFTAEQVGNPTQEVNEAFEKMSMVKAFDLISKKSVWFRIHKNFLGKYGILMYYDNEYNKAHGEDL